MFNNFNKKKKNRRTHNKLKKKKKKKKLHEWNWKDYYAKYLSPGYISCIRVGTYNSQELLFVNWLILFIFSFIEILNDQTCASHVDWSMPLLKFGEKRYYLGVFFKVNEIYYFKYQNYWLCSLAALRVSALIIMYRWRQ